MSIPLKDLRLGISESTHAVLDAVARASGRDMAAVAREILQEWTNRKLEEHELIVQLMRNVPK